MDIREEFNVDLLWELNSLSTGIPSRKNGNLFIPLVSGDEHRNIKNGICSYFPDKCCFSSSLSCFSPLTKSLTQVRRIPVQPFLHPTQIRLSPSSNWAVCKVSRDPWSSISFTEGQDINANQAITTFSWTITPHEPQVVRSANLVLVWIFEFSPLSSINFCEILVFLLFFSDNLFEKMLEILFSLFLVSASMCFSATVFHKSRD